ncbi:MAG: BamA/TamA family outer membrane protein [SAR324 cluster bacterium]|nr:BamA/TamA family outer membrane protein [SAR324 cluster bacterium]
MKTFFILFVFFFLVIQDPFPSIAQEAHDSSKSLLGYVVNKPVLSKKNLAKKRELEYFVPIPLLAFDPDIGWGTGIRLYYYSNGEKTDPLFRYTPYFHRIFGQAFLTTKNAQFSILDLDSPYLWGTLFRVRSRILLVKNPTTNYFGIGNESLRHFQLPVALQSSDSPNSFSKLKDYDKELKQTLPNGETYAQYYKYTYHATSWRLALERDLYGGLVRLMGGIRIEKNDIYDYSGEEVQISSGKKGKMGKTKLREDHEAGKIIGFRGGMDNIIKFGIAYDSRDFEPAPNSGIFADAAVEISEPSLGSDFDYARALTAIRGYYTPFLGHLNMVLAGRGLYYAHVGKVPFFNVATIASTEGKFRGMGGRRSLRGYKQDRFMGKVGALLNLEARWNFQEFNLLEQHFALLFTPFLDTGRVFDDSRETTLAHWKQGQGLGLRIAWNQATIIALEYGWSHEDSGAYLLFNHTF